MYKLNQVMSMEYDIECSCSLRLYGPTQLLAIYIAKLINIMSLWNQRGYGNPEYEDLRRLRKFK